MWSSVWFFSHLDLYFDPCCIRFQLCVVICKAYILIPPSFLLLHFSVLNVVFFYIMWILGYFNDLKWVLHIHHKFKIENGVEQAFLPFFFLFICSRESVCGHTPAKLFSDFLRMCLLREWAQLFYLTFNSTVTLEKLPSTFYLHLLF